MSRRVSLPNADDLFRPTAAKGDKQDKAVRAVPDEPEAGESQDESADRGRLVREAVALVLADFDAHGDDSALVRRLTEE